MISAQIEKVGYRMSIKDTLQRFIFENIPVRGELIRLEKSFSEIIHQHDYPEPLKQLLGEALCVAGLLSAIIKFNGRLTVQFRGEGKLKFLLAQCNNKFELRGLAKWDGEITNEELIESFKQGVLVIMLDSGPTKQRYQGIVAWRGNSLAESIEGYFRDSEQLATKIWLAVNKHSAAGYLLQVIPAVESEMKMMEEQAVAPHWDHIRALTLTLSSDMLFLQDAAGLLQTLYPEETIRIFPEEKVSFKCTCSRKRGRDAILILGQKEAEEELATKNSLSVTCDFCNKEYIFDRIDVAEIFEKHNKPPSNTQLH